jgi:hypothetical protein
MRPDIVPGGLSSIWNSPRSTRRSRWRTPGSRFHGWNKQVKLESTPSGRKA